MNSGWQHETTEPTDWEQWLARHAPALLLFARQQARCEADAQDLVQDAVVESWQRNVVGTPPPIGLVYATIRRRAVDLVRRNERRAGREAAVHSGSQGFWFDTGLEDRERTRLIEEAMRALPAIYRDTVTLKIWGGLTFAQIGEALDIPANTAASRYRYGLAELRKVAREVFA